MADHVAVGGDEAVGWGVWLVLWRDETNWDELGKRLGLLHLLHHRRCLRLREWTIGADLIEHLSGGAVSDGAVSGGAVSGAVVSGGAVSGGAVSGHYQKQVLALPLHP